MYSFSLVLDVPEASVDDANALYDVCDGVLVRSSVGSTYVDVDCDAASLDAAATSAIAQVEQALPHANVIRVEVDRANLVTTSPAA